jgi:hypothetical protein
MSWLPQELENRNETLYSKLVPFMGKCDTVEGETLRAINRIVYRRYNDGDCFYEGYGTETCGPAHAYLVGVSPVRAKLRPIFEEAINGDYEGSLNKALAVVLDWIEGQSEYAPNSVDMLECQAHFEDEEDSSDYSDYWDEDEDEDY